MILFPKCGIFASFQKQNLVLDGVVGCFVDLHLVGEGEDLVGEVVGAEGA